jgi:hypothetical protein
MARLGLPENPLAARLGFAVGFGVKLAVLWLFGGSLPQIWRQGIPPKRPTKMTGTGEATSVMLTTWFDPECI